MELLNKVKRIMTAPKKEWTVIEAENTSHGKLFTEYVLPLALISAITAFVLSGLIGLLVLGTHLYLTLCVMQAVSLFIAMTGGVYLTAFIVNILADSFGATKNFDKAFALVAYSYTPMLLGGVFLFLSHWLTSLAGIYGLYLQYIGLQPMMKNPPEKTAGYFIIILVVEAIVATVLSWLFFFILIKSI
jgi:hypothetical protein